ncbi:MAG: tRNA pseudouridine(38-40) synthase TruA [Eubacterium sp.]|nr:tRNA pseudouridine(38-40) synthase TruA [Eubacterium sp.]
MRRLLITIKYDGSDYHGWQVQKNALSVQEVFQNAVEKVFCKRLDVKGCSRTDSGVHANEYFVSLDTDMDIADNNVVLALNTYLPEGVAAIGCKEVSADFHPRYSCKSKQYQYRIHNSKIRNPFLRRYAFQYSREIDENYLDREAKAFLGTHDFSGFCSVKSDVEDTVRTVYHADVYRKDDMVYFEFEADGFLYNMVRIMVGTLLFINEGKIKEGELSEIIDSKDRTKAGKTAPPHGLYLNKVNY